MGTPTTNIQDLQNQIDRENIVQTMLHHLLYKFLIDHGLASRSDVLNHLHVASAALGEGEHTQELRDVLNRLAMTFPEPTTGKSRPVLEVIRGGLADTDGPDPPAQ
jgi:hypothetical protein